MPTTPETISISASTIDSVRKPASCTVGSSRLQPPQRDPHDAEHEALGGRAQQRREQFPAPELNRDCWPMPALTPNRITLISAVRKLTSKNTNGMNPATCRMLAHSSIRRPLVWSIRGM